MGAGGNLPYLDRVEDHLGVYNLQTQQMVNLKKVLFVACNHTSKKLKQEETNKKTYCVGRKMEARGLAKVLWIIWWSHDGLNSRNRKQEDWFRVCF